MASNIYDLYVRLYGRLLANGRRTLEEIPEKYREDAKAWAIANYGEKALG